MDYELSWGLQKERVTNILFSNEDRHEGGGQDPIVPLSRANLLLLLEHPPVYTVGRSGRQQDILRQTSSKEIPVIQTDRGGKVTYHGPGQLVAYVVCDLRPHALLAVRNHVTQLEETVLRTLVSLGVVAHTEPKNPGVWVGNAKIAALGVKIHRGVAYHGVAINRDPDLDCFGDIIPCGLTDRPVTSLANLGLNIDRISLEACFISAFCDVFDTHWEPS